MKLMEAFVRALPRSLVYAFAMFPVVWYFVIRSEGRCSSNGYQTRLGRAEGKITRFLFGLGQARAFSQIILDNMYLGIKGPDKFHLHEYGTEVLRECLNRGKGLILLSAHVGNWHLAVNFLGYTDTRVHLVIDDVREAEVKRQMDRAKEKSAHLTVHDARRGLDLVFELKSALSRGEIVILAGDRVTTGRKKRASFLGAEAWFPTSAFTLARLTGAPVCTALCFRTGMQRYDCTAIGPFEGDSEEEMLRQFSIHLEAHLKHFPKQWFNFFDFWG
jgi:predicted LPLAT superfamily acyltransferase